MISKAKACPGGTALFLYVMKENKGYELFRNKLSGETPKEIYNEMAIIQRQNLKCDNNTISIVLSPAIKDSSKMSDSQLQNLTTDVLKEMNLDPNIRQFLAYVHTEKKHKHIHILLNRVRNDGTLIKDTKIGRSAQKAAHIAATKHGFISAKDIKEFKERDKKLAKKKIIEEIKKACYYVLKRHPRNLTEFQREMAKFNIEVNPTINKQGNIQGFRFKHLKTKTDLKASEVDRKLKLHKLLYSGKSFEKKGPKGGIISKRIQIEFVSTRYYLEKDPKKNRKRGRNRGNS